jgi:hypothetical protein
VYYRFYFGEGSLLDAKGVKQLLKLLFWERTFLYGYFLLGLVLSHRGDYFLSAANPDNFFPTGVDTFGFELTPNGVD